jgi:hypothetical protein
MTSTPLLAAMTLFVLAGAATATILVLSGAPIPKLTERSTTSA